MTDAVGTEKQLRYLEAYRRLGSYGKAAAELGVNKSTVHRVLRTLAARCPDVHAREAPTGYALRGVSTLVGPDGEVKQQWIKTAREAPTFDALREVAEEIAETCRGALPPIDPPAETDDSLLAAYPFADPHIGMLSWARETGENFDLDIAEELIGRTVDRLVASAPSATEALLLLLGDYLHTDGEGGTTTRGTPQDVDSRFAKLAIVGARIARRMIDRLLQKHGTVTVQTLPGNHDSNQAVWLALVLAAAYERDPRVQITISPAALQVTRFGQCLIGAAHGHAAKPDRLPSYMAATWPDDWGETRHRIWYTGHVHHDSVREYPGCLVETLRTVAPKDAWHVAHGYSSGRDLKCDVWHEDHGRIARLIQKAV